MRERLIELIVNADTYDEYECKLCAKDDDACDCCYAEKLADYLLANGVIVLPCKVGSAVYKVVKDKRIKSPYECKVVGFWYSADERCNNAHLVRYVNGVFDCSFSVPIEDFGKTIFLTRAEAEQALKDMRKE